MCSSREEERLPCDLEMMRSVGCKITMITDIGLVMHVSQEFNFYCKNSSSELEEINRVIASP